MIIKKKPILDNRGKPSKAWIQAMSKLQLWRKGTNDRTEDTKNNRKV